MVLNKELYLSSVFSKISGIKMQINSVEHMQELMQLLRIANKDSLRSSTKELKESINYTNRTSKTKRNKEALIFFLAKLSFRIFSLKKLKKY